MRFKILLLFGLLVTLIWSCSAPIKKENSFEPCREIVESPDEPALEAASKMLVKAVGYPDDLRRRRVEGTQTIALLINTQGRAIDSKIISSLDRKHDQFVLQKVKRITFRPSKHQGKPVCAWLVIPIVYRLAYIPQ